jgi:hypothetical protein
VFDIGETHYVTEVCINPFASYAHSQASHIKGPTKKEEEEEE